MSITEFLLARIAEDESSARNASPGPWAFSDIDSVGGGTLYDPTVAIANVQWDAEHVDSRIRRTRPSWQADATGKHIARHDPTRVLAECAAKRAIIEEHAIDLDMRDPYCDTCAEWWKCEVGEGPPMVKYPCPTIRALTAVYKDHKDYDPEWSPNGG